MTTNAITTTFYKKNEQGQLYVSRTINIAAFIVTMLSFLDAVPAPYLDEKATAKDAVENIFNNFRLECKDDGFAWDDHNIVFSVDSGLSGVIAITAINKITKQAITLVVIKINNLDFTWKVCRMLSESYALGRYERVMDDEK